jgi:predicted RNA polymerase sigma factor
VLPVEMHIALALKTLCGFSPKEIAVAFLTSEAAIAKRLVRARQKIRDAGVKFEIPEGEEVSTRLDGVLHTLYLLFNEGYKASSGESLLREDLCAEAIRLATALVEHPVGNQPRAHALLALMFLNSARSPARLDANGGIEQKSRRVCFTSTNRRSATNCPNITYKPGSAPVIAPRQVTKRPIGRAFLASTIR